MAILLLLLLVVAGLLVGDVAVENTAATTLTVAGRELDGLSLGGWLLAFTALGFVAAYMLLGMLAAARRDRTRRRALRSSEREMAERVAELERENLTLRRETRDGADTLEHMPPTGPPADGSTDHGRPHRDERVERDERGRRLTPPATAHTTVPDSDHVRDHPLGRDRTERDDAKPADRARTSDRV
jgi:uncharacterized membrane protein YccC